MENSKQKIVLTGFMGVGKSSVARHLAYLLRCEQIDLDDFIVNQEQQEIAQILQTVGERRFRQIETEIIGSECAAVSFPEFYEVLSSIVNRKNK